jgi:DNA-binding beta-propeller fold protein YncE
VHPNNQSAFALNWADRSIISIDLASGDRTILSGDATGTGPSFDLPAGIALNAAGNQLLVVDRDLSALVEVNVATGDRTIISDPSTGIGPELNDLSDVIYGLDESHAYVFDKVLGIFEIDLSTGDRTQISGTTKGNGFFPATPNQYTKLLLDKSKRLIYMLDSSKGFLVAVELSSGDRALLPVE